MTENEIKLAVEALYWYVQFKDVCPDIGMGDWPERLLKNIEERTGVKINNDIIMAAYKDKHGKQRR